MSEAVVQYLRRISLVPVLELEPGRYSTREHKSPDYSLDVAPEEDEVYWRSCLADSGLRGLRNLTPGSWQVPIRGIRPNELLVILSKSFDAPLEELKLENNPVLAGGFALFEEDKLVLEAQCSGDLAVLKSWADLAGYRHDSWAQFSIGRPKLPARRTGTWLELSEPDEDASPVPKWRLLPEGLDASVQAALLELEGFVPAILETLKDVPGLAQVEEVARNLAGLGKRTRWKREAP